MEEFKRIFSEITKDFEILRYDRKSSDSYTCKVQCLLHYDGEFDEKYASFVESFSKQTNSNWVMKRRFAEPTRYEFRKLFVSHLSERNKLKNKTQGVNRNFNCKSTLNIKFLKTTQSTLKSSVLLRKGYNVVIDIHFSHSHRVNVA